MNIQQQLNSIKFPEKESIPAPQSNVNPFIGFGNWLINFTIAMVVVIGVPYSFVVVGSALTPSGTPIIEYDMNYQ